MLKEKDMSQIGYNVEYLLERVQVEDIVTKLFVATDERDWHTVEACFTDTFLLDMTSLAGGIPAKMKPSEVTTAWAAAFTTLDHVHHQIGNFQTAVNGLNASVCCYGIALHRRDEIADPVKTRTFVGAYEFDLVKQGAQWRIARLMYKLKFIDGNLNLETAK
jgi:hypothetical protein